MQARQNHAYMWSVPLSTAAMDEPCVTYASATSSIINFININVLSMNTTIRLQIVLFSVVLLSLALAFVAFTPAHAFEQTYFNHSGGEDNDITVSIVNTADITNVLEVEAETGENKADGGDGEEGGSGGDAEGAGDNTGGEGGAGGDGALGGVIYSGHAAAYATVYNRVNTTRTYIEDSCGCEEEDSSPTFFFWMMPSRDRGDDRTDNDIRVSLENAVRLVNELEVEAETGDNRADGGDGEEGGNGGDAEARYEEPLQLPFFGFWPMPDGDSNQGGAGGAGGTGGVGGDIVTGDAVSGADVVNVVNRTVTRIIR